jgi:hypothetical protein
MGSESSVEIELGKTEKLLWSGRPPTGIMFRSSDALMVPFSIMWGGFAIFWEVSVLRSNAPFFFGIWGIPFVLMGLYMIAGRFYVDAKQRENTWYGITNDRIIILTGYLKRNIKSLNLQTLTDVSLTEHTGHRGTITFGPTPPFYSSFSGSTWLGMGNRGAPSFEMIDDARSAYEIINVARRKITS